MTQGRPAEPEPEPFSREYWDARYQSRQSLWSGKPNPRLAAEVSGLAPGSALDAGAGEGADAIWLAGQGWTVTALDISGVALERAVAHAAEAGPDVAGRISWRQADLMEWRPPESGYDLVAVHYLQLPAERRQVIYPRLAAAVTAGGTLLIVAHHPSDLRTTVPRPPDPGLFFTGDDLARAVGGAGWEIVTNAAIPREVTDPDGNPATVHDTVYRARRS